MPSTLGPGIDIKWRGYVVAPPSRLQGSPQPYCWDVGAHLLETPLAAFDLPHTARPARAKIESVDDARDTFLGAAFESLGWLGAPLGDGRRIVRCPWAAEHSDGRGAGQDSSTVLMPRTRGASLGLFLCAHAHCAQRTLRDVLRALPQEALRHAHLATMGLRNQAVYERLGASRG
jgi:hypothetical protein